MNNYNDKEIELMNNNELKQFVGIATKMLDRAKTNALKAKIALDVAQKLYERIDIDLEDGEGYDSWNPCPHSYTDLRVAGKKVSKLEFKLKEINNQLFYLKRTIGRAKTEANMRSGVDGKVSSIINDLFDEV